MGMLRTLKGTFVLSYMSLLPILSILKQLWVTLFKEKKKENSNSIVTFFFSLLELGTAAHSLKTPH